MAGFRIVHMDDFERPFPKWALARKSLGLQSFGMNIVELGLVYRVEPVDARIEIDMTMTTAACPVADLLVEQATQAVQRICPPGTEVRVQLVWEPIWNPSMMSEVARTFFGWQG